MASKLEYAVVGKKPDGTMMFHTGRGFVENESEGMRWQSVEFAALTGKQEQEAHPNWQIDLRVYEGVR